MKKWMVLLVFVAGCGEATLEIYSDGQWEGVARIKGAGSFSAEYEDGVLKSVSGNTSRPGLLDRSMDMGMNILTLDVIAGD